MNTKREDVTTLKQMDDFSKSILDQLSTNVSPVDATIITLSGDLGAGKTTFTQFLGKHLGVTENINSPTYVIEQRYPALHHHFAELVHIDAYRLEQQDDAIKIGLDKTLDDPTNIVVIEWPEKIADFLENYKKIEIFLSSEDENRTAEIR